LNDRNIDNRLNNILVTGANGFIGARLVNNALQMGYGVKTLTRSNWSGHPKIDQQSRYYYRLPYDIPEEAFDNVDTVIHCAAQLEGSEKDSYSVNVEGTLKLAKMARDAQIRNFVFLSSQSAKPDAVSVYGKTKYAAEHGLLQLEGIHVIIIRPGLVTGPGSRGLFQNMSNMVNKLPIIPLLGGGKSIVQPVHVDDLCNAILKSIQLGSDSGHNIYRIGLSEGITLAHFLKQIAKVRYNKNKLMLSVPLWPIEIGVKVTEMLRIPLPINSNNLKGLKTVEKMDTENDIVELGIQLRSLKDTIKDDDTMQPKKTKIILIGAGRIGLVHALTLSRLSGIDFCGMVDPNKKATNMLLSMGLKVPIFRDLDTAIQEAKPDAAVIATPVFTHLSLAQKCLEHNIPIMIEKPLAIRKEDLLKFSDWVGQHKELPVSVGYVLARNPQIVTCINELIDGKYGKVLGFTGVTLLSLIQAKDLERWEVKKSKSGGGALINAGGHVLSMIYNALGKPLSLSSSHSHLFSSEVEDSIVTHFDYGEFKGQLYCSWSINGYPRQENLLTIYTEQGKLILSGSVGAFIRHNGTFDIHHQLDYDMEFNLAPDYAGAGFTTEMLDLKEAAENKTKSPMNIDRAIDIENVLFEIYEHSQEVERFSEQAFHSVDNQTSFPDSTTSITEKVNRILDLREISIDRVTNFVNSKETKAVWNEYVVNPEQAKSLLNKSMNWNQLRVTVPDFLNQARMLSGGRYQDVLKQMGVKGVVSATSAALPLLFKEHGPTFWVAAMGLLGSSLKSIPKGFSGTLLLHGYLTDVALSLNRHDILDKMIALCRKRHPRARVGIHTNMLIEVSHALKVLKNKINDISVLSSPNAYNMEKHLENIRNSSDNIRITVEVGIAPALIHQLAYKEPSQWLHGTSDLVIGIEGEPSLYNQLREEREFEWNRVFPGLSYPHEVL
jgi:nucleoside-diphosphate-sugar epimerase/predicted dehydrogenase